MHFWTCRQWRPDYFPSAGNYRKFLPRAKYFEALSAALYVTSPGGDRPDTYRNWESISFNALPISNIPRAAFGQLFGDDMLNVESKSDLDALLTRLQDCSTGVQSFHRPSREVLLLDYWRRVASAAREKRKGTPVMLPRMEPAVCASG